MQLSRFSDYALRTLMYLACHPDRLVSIQEIASAHAISPHHLAKAAQALTRRGWVEAQRGRSGGLRMAIEPRRLTIGRVVREIEPSLAIVECFDPDKDQCRISGACRLRGALERAKEAFLRELDDVALEDLTANRSELITLLATTA